MKSLVLGMMTAMLCLCEAALAAVSGTVWATRDVQVADTSIVPQAITAGEYIRVDPKITSTKWMTEFTVKTADGKVIKIVQDRDPSIQVGAAVTVVTVDGHDRVARSK